MGRSIGSWALLGFVCLFAGTASVAAVAAQTNFTKKWSDRTHLAQTSTTTNCMMTCNSQWATCQASCIVPGTAPSGAATSTSNANASSTCVIGCGNQQMSCQTNCALASPSQ